MLDASAEVEEPADAAFAGDGVVGEEGEERAPEDASADGEALRVGEVEIVEHEAKVGEVAEAGGDRSVEQVDAEDSVEGEEDEEEFAFGLNAAGQVEAAMEIEDAADGEQDHEAGDGFAEHGRVWALQPPQDQKRKRCNDSEPDDAGEQQMVRCHEEVADQEEVVDGEGEQATAGELAEALVGSFCLEARLQKGLEAGNGRTPGGEAFAAGFHVEEILREIAGLGLVNHSFQA